MRPIQDVGSALGYFHLLEASEKARWIFDEVPWDSIDEERVTPDDLHNAQVAAYGELTTFSATESFMKLFRDDIDFTQWLAVWFYEETKHPLALIKWLGKLRVPVQERFIHDGREISPMTESPAEMLTFNICSEIAANSIYYYMGKTTQEPVMREILRNLARDEMRHSNGFQFYCRKRIERSNDPDGERLRCLRAAWFLLQPSSSGMTQHPVFLTLRKMRGLDFDQLEKRVREKIAMRIARVVDLEIQGPDALYDVYTGFRKSYRERRRPALEMEEVAHGAH